MTRNVAQDGTPLSAVFFNGLLNSNVSEAVVSGCTPSKGTGDFDVDIASGTALVGSNGEVSVSSGTETLTSPGSDADLDSGETRVDLITVDSNGATNTTEGSPHAGTDADPVVAPDIPLNEVLLAAVTVDGDANSLTSGDINDYRVLKTEGVRTDMITIWSGAIVDIPAGWVLCDGNNGTPNLQDKFVVGAGNSFSVDGTGGESTHQLTTSELASHNHGADADQTSSGVTGSTFDDGSSTNKTLNTNNTGGDSAHENKPPYHALAYIQKV